MHSALCIRNYMKTTGNKKQPPTFTNVNLFINISNVKMLAD